MHATSLENMQRCYEHYLSRSPLINNNKIQVLDVGGANVNGSYSDIFSDARFQYIGADISPANGVDLVLQDPYQLPFHDNSVDIILCGQAFEHVEFFWRLFEEMSRILHDDGLIFLIVPSQGPIHRYPVDCYRFLPDTMPALARYTGISLVKHWMDSRGPWHDLVGVFSKNPSACDLTGTVSKPPVNRYSQEYAATPIFEYEHSENIEQNKIQGSISYLSIMQTIQDNLSPRLYLEIGVRKGNSLNLASCPSVAIDPSPAPDISLKPSHQLFTETSDQFFEEHAERAFETTRPDLVFIDGMHLFECVLRDFINVELNCSPSTLIVIDDIFPNHAEQAKRKRSTRVWTGDVWKFHDCLKKNRPDLLLLPLDVKPTGLLLVAGLNPKNDILSERYNRLINKAKQAEFCNYEQHIIGRKEAVAPDDSIIDALVALLRAVNNSTTLQNNPQHLYKMLSTLKP